MSCLKTHLVRSGCFAAGVAATFALLAEASPPQGSPIATALAGSVVTTPGGGPLSCTEVEAIIDSALGTTNRALEKLEALPPNPNLVQITTTVSAVTTQVATTTLLVADAIVSLELLQLKGQGCPTLEALIRIIAKLTDLDALLDFVTAQLPLLLNPLLPPSQFNTIKNAIIDSLLETVALLEAALKQIGEPPPPPPANDECADATAAGVGSIDFTTVGATSSGLFPLGCAGLVPPLDTSDVWFSYMPSCDGTATASVCGANFDTLLAVYAGSCESPILVGCNDDADGCGTASSVSFETVCGETYSIRIGGQNEQGDGTLTISCSGPSCPDVAEPLACDELAALLGSATATAGRAVDKLEALPPAPTPVEVLNAVVGVNVQVAALSADIAQAVLSLEILQSLGEGCPTLEAVLRALLKLASVEALLVQVTVDLQLLLDPLLPPDDFEEIKQGIVVVLEDVIATVDAVIDQLVTGPPPNDDCTDALPIASGPVDFTTTGATDDGPAFPTNCVGVPGPLVVFDVWFSYTAECDGTTTASVCNSADFDTIVAVYTGGCADPTLVGCNDDGAGCGETSAATFEAICGVTYLIRVGGFNEEGSGTLEVTCAGGKCQPCIGDLNHDGIVDGADLGILLAAWDNRGEADLNEDGTVDGADLGILLAAWGTCPS